MSEQRTSADLREQSTKCKNPRAAAILGTVADWLEGVAMDPHEFADMWVSEDRSEARRARRKCMENTTQEE